MLLYLREFTFPSIEDEELFINELKQTWYNTYYPFRVLGDKELEKLPENLDVLATMNTADRSLAVVDFALRRRFGWYTIRPQEIKPNSNQVFHKNLFKRFCEIFDRYASDEELNLQPGPSYFLTPANNGGDIMKNRMIYELMPLVKEYLAEGLMKKAADSFSQLFYEETKKYLYE